jgi:hypothetical protein
LSFLGLGLETVRHPFCRAQENQLSWESVLFCRAQENQFSWGSAPSAGHRKTNSLGEVTNKRKFLLKFLSTIREEVTITDKVKM